MNGVQHTVKRPVTLEGVGLHTGVKTSVTFHPAPEDSGIRFLRSDLPGGPTVRADIDRVTRVSRGTVLSDGGIEVHTVEHVLAAAAGLEIDNLLIELTNKEPPALDGSSRGFVEALIEGGITAQKGVRRVMVVDEPVRVEDRSSGSTIEVTPSENFTITCVLEYDHPVPGHQEFILDSMGLFAREIAPARTYCFLSELEDLKRRGLARGGTLENALVIADKELDEGEMSRLKSLFDLDRDLVLGSNGILQGTPLRFEDEAVRHKVLDILGDLALLGQPIQGHVTARRSGHASHVELVRRIRKLSLEHA